MRGDVGGRHEDFTRSSSGDFGDAMTSELCCL